MLKKVKLQHANIPEFQSVLQTLQTDRDGFMKVAALVREVAGIHLPLNDKNLLMMAGRLSPLFRAYQIQTYDDYLDILSQRDPAVLRDLVAALTTHTTEFFREAAHFDILKNVLPKILARKGVNPEIRVWCAAASTGQEPYTLAITLLESMAQTGPFTIKMLATDIDMNVLERANEGIYTEHELGNMPANIKQKYFNHVEVPRPGYKVVPSMRKLIRFAPFNLMQEPYPFQHPFDFVFCRNVLIYFERDTSEKVVRKMLNGLNVGGYLFLGHSETGVLRSPAVRTAGTAVYERIA